MTAGYKYDIGKDTWVKVKDGGATDGRDTQSVSLLRRTRGESPSISTQRQRTFTNSEAEQRKAVLVGWIYPLERNGLGLKVM